MASYRALGGTQHAELDNGLVPGNDIITAAQVNGASLSKGHGALRLKEVNASTGEPVQGARSYSFKYGETITVA